MAKYSQETTILSPRDPSLDLNSNDWPEFDLSNVTVHLPHKPSATTSLFLATEDFPLTVRGQLEVSNKQKHHFCQPVSKTRVSIEITDVKTFSYGQDEYGTEALWAAGKAGWYKISPSRTYGPFFQEMIDAVIVFYFIVDAYREPRKSGRGKNASILPPFRARELFQKYASEVMEEPSDLAKAADKFYHHKDFVLSSMVAGEGGLSWGHNPLFLHLRKRFPSEYATIKSRAKGSRAGSADVQKGSRQGSAETSSHPSGRKRKRGRLAPSNTQKEESADSKSHSESEAVTGTNHEEIRDESQDSRRRSARSNASGRVRRTASMESQADPEAVQSDNSDDEDRVEMQVRRKRKSLLRLKPSKASKSATRSGKAPMLSDEPPDDESQLSSSPDKMIPETRSTSRLILKRRGGNTHEDEGIDMADSHSEEDITVSPTASQAADQQEFEALSLRTLDHQPDGIQEDTWVCALDGCSHKVYAASNPESQKLIREHYALHAYDDDDRVQMVKRLQAPSLPVRHLMERVRQQAKVEGFPGSRVAGTRFPDTALPLAVVQKY